MRIATWNVNSLKARLERVLAWTERHAPDALCLQETKMGDGAVPVDAFRRIGYEVVHHGTGRWNGVAIASRVGIEGVVAGLPATLDGWADEGGRFLSAVCGGVRIASVYVPNGRVVDSDFYRAKLTWLDRLAAWVDERGEPPLELALCGDFNVAPDDRDVWDPLAAHGGTHVSPAERERLAGLRDRGLVDVVRLFHEEPGYFTWWDYRAGCFHKNIGMRIDHIFVSEGLARRATRADRDRDARKPSTYPGIPSDHAPVVADFDGG